MSNISYIWILKYSEEMHCSECQIYLTLANMKRITLLFMIWILFYIWRNQRFETAGDHECAKSFKHSYKRAFGGSVWGTKVFVTGCNASLLSWNLSECRHFQSISNTGLDSCSQKLWRWRLTWHGCCFRNQRPIQISVLNKYSQRPLS